MSTPKSPGDGRPLSPFMIGPYYRPQLTSMLSITHRATGVGLSAGTLLLAWWLIALASGPEAFECVSGHVSAWYGQVLLFAWTWALLYHLCNGIRHLLWDVGKNLEIEAAYKSGYVVVAASAILTVVVWIAACI